MTQSGWESRIFDLEDVLVKQFRMLQKLADVTREERECLVKANNDRILVIVEEKEAILDQLDLLEDERRLSIQKLAIKFQSLSETTSLAAVLPYLDRVKAEQLQHLADGVMALAEQTRDLSYGNQALVSARLDWIRSFLTFLMRVSLPEEGYFPPTARYRTNGPAISGVVYRA